MRARTALTLVVLGSAWMVACGGRDDRGGGDPMGGDDAGMMMTPDAGGPEGLALLGNGTNSAAEVEVTVIATEADSLNVPRDLAFNPEVPSQLWILNNADNSTTILLDPGTEAQDWRKRNGFGNDHFLASPAGIAFGAPGTFASVHETDEETQPSTPYDFMGPTLWTSDIEIYDSGHASHLDMLHNSPNAVGIAWDHDNVYWVFDGFHSSITKYDFQEDHDLGGEDHSDGIIVRYAEGEVGYVPEVSSGMELDHATGLLYIADSGNGRVAVMDTASGARGATIGPNYDGVEMYAMDGATLTTLVDGAAVGLSRPSGLALSGGMLFVADNEGAKIFAFDLEGNVIDWLDLSGEIGPGDLQGIAFDAEGRLYLVDSGTSRILRVAPLS